MRKEEKWFLKDIICIKKIKDMYVVIQDFHMPTFLINKREDFIDLRVLFPPPKPALNPLHPVQRVHSLPECFSGVGGGCGRSVSASERGHF